MSRVQNPRWRGNQNLPNLKYALYRLAPQRAKPVCADYAYTSFRFMTNFAKAIVYHPHIKMRKASMLLYAEHQFTDDTAK